MKLFIYLLTILACVFCDGCCFFSFTEHKLRSSGTIVVKNKLRFGDTKLHETQLTNDQTIKIAIKRGYWTSDLFLKFNINNGYFFLSGENGKIKFLPKQVTIDISHNDDFMLAFNGTFSRCDTIPVGGYKRKFSKLHRENLYLFPYWLINDQNIINTVQEKNRNVQVCYYPLLNLKTSVEKKFIFLELPFTASNDFEGNVEIWVSYNWYNDL